MSSTHYDVLFVGSVPLSDTEDVFRTIGGLLGNRVSRIPDGETGDRLKWVEAQVKVFESNPAFVARAVEARLDSDWRNSAAPPGARTQGWYTLAPGLEPKDIVFGPLGYAAAARTSYAIFSRLKAEGVIQPACRFQVSLPTPYSVIDSRVHPEQRLDVEPFYERRMLAEVDEIVAAVPPAELAIQWDAAHEIQNLDGARPHWFADPFEGMIERLTRLGDHVPAGAELGYHFCYGDFNHQHIIEPRDTGVMVEVADALAARIGRRIDYIHMPVPRARTDPGYFSPLGNLRLTAGTTLYLGLVHLTDGVEGTRRRIAAARESVADFGIAAECGFGRRKPDTIPALLQVHAEVSAVAWRLGSG